MHMMIAPLPAAKAAKKKDEAGKAEKLAQAEDILAQLQASDDKVNLFDKLMHEHSEDPGLESYPDGYDTFPGQMVPAFNDWCFDEARQPGDVTVIQSETSGYSYVLLFENRISPDYATVDVRHILVEAQVADKEAGATDKEMALALEQAEKYLAEWQEGEATEESFAALANEKSTDTGSNTNGGLYENIYPGQMVEPFEDWCYGDRKAGDTGLVETEYGVHIMYYVGESEQTYRDFMITNTLVSADAQAWYDALVEAVSTTDGNTKYIDKTLVISAK